MSMLRTELCGARKSTHSVKFYSGLSRVGKEEGGEEEDFCIVLDLLHMSSSLVQPCEPARL